MVTLPGGLTAEAVIFDFDGVIVDTEPIHYQAFQEVLNPLGIFFSWENYVNRYMGFDDRDAFNEAFKNTIPVNRLKELIQQKALCFISIIQKGIKAYPGAVELIQTLHKKRVPLAISSGALRTDIDPILEILGITDCFDVIVTADDVSKSKPDPECYKLAHKKLEGVWDRQFPPLAVVAIEDTPAGIIAAKDAGLSVIAVSNSYPPDNLNYADKIVATLLT